MPQRLNVFSAFYFKGTAGWGGRRGFSGHLFSLVITKAVSLLSWQGEGMERRFKILHIDISNFWHCISKC